MLSPPAATMYSVTPHDTNALPTRARALYITGAGNVAFVPQVGEAAIVVTVAALSILPCAAYRVNSTSTTATGIWALV